MSRELEREVKRRYRGYERNLEPRIRAMVAAQPLMAPDYALALNAAQNTLKDCIQTAVAQALPQERMFFVELATRLACYVLTVLHPDDQEPHAMMVRDGLLNKLGDMQAAGNVLKGEWE